jgi:Uma2 family endonuclease
VKLIDVAWISAGRRQTQRGQTSFTQASEICVVITSPGNSRRELDDKKELYFAAGAEEVWFCGRDGKMEFFRKATPESSAASILCPRFPQRLE